MAIDLTATPQATTEIRTHFVDFTKDLPGTVVVSSAVAGTVAFPTGGTAVLAVGAISANIVPLTVTNPAPAGDYTVSLTATLSDAEKIVALLHIPVIWQAVRSGMDYLITELRGMTNAGYEDYKVAGAYYWSDKHLQDALDRYRADVLEEDLYAVQQTRNGTTYYLEYRSQFGNLEGVASGTSVFKLDNAAGTNLSGTLWTADYQRGVITFNNDSLGSTVLLTARSYDLNAAAADVWRRKMAHYAEAYTISTDRQSLQRSQLIQQCQVMADYYAGQARPQVLNMMRGDMVGSYDE